MKNSLVHLLANLWLTVFCLLLMVFGINSLAGTTVLQVSEYMKKSNELRSLETKLKDAEARVKANLAAKAKATTPAAQHEAMDGMIKAHNELKKLTTDYNKVRAELKYKFPGKGDEIEGHYKPHEMKSIEEIDRSISLDAQLTKTKRVMEKKLAPIAGHPETVTQPAAKPIDSNHEPEEPPPLRLER